MEQWVIPVLSAVIVIEWTIIWAIRRQRDMATLNRIAGLDALVTFVGLVLLISSLQYVTVNASEIARISVNTLRIVLFGTGLYVLGDLLRHSDDEPD